MHEDSEHGRVARGTVLLAEWGDRFSAALGPERLELRIVEREDGTRDLSARAFGAGPEHVLARWSERCP